MTPIIQTLSPKKLIGQKATMSLADNQTFRLWQSFMPRRKEIKNRSNAEMISMQVGDAPWIPGDVHQMFEKWAAVEVSDFEFVPDGMETFELIGGLYAVFYYKGLNTDIEIFKFIFGTWLPQSEYELDDRPHFEILGEKYKNNDPDSEEEIWIPIKEK